MNLFTESQMTIPEKEKEAEAGGGGQMSPQNLQKK